jgi:beta-aspartyl-peptidase (threonine type)
MSSNFRRTVLWALALVFAATVAASRSTGAQGPDGQIAAIKKVLDKQEQDWNKGDLDAFLEGYWKSPHAVFQSGGDRHVGFEAMRERYRKRYQAEGRAMGKVTFSDVEIEILGMGYEAAFVRGRWGLTMPDGKKPGGLFTLIFRKFPEGWKIVHDHTSIAEEPAKPAQTAPPAG